MGSVLSGIGSSMASASSGLVPLGVLIATVLLLAVQFEFAQYLPGERAQRLSRIVLVGLVPVLIVFSMTVMVKFVQELGTR